MRRLTVTRHPIGILGVWAVKQGSTYIATIVQPEPQARMGLRPSADEVRQAVRDIAPGYGVTDTTPVSGDDE